ncbi:helix-turn-helix domain-containing protein [Moraxella nonliquefaciens]|jgi:DNA-binding protein|uniref:helix-turn-helix domain-containing protein n=1 Tax=Moraxella nonliquefaciens TaxID=478 RepID=UPI001EF6170F|nr:helix-turn-helix transcriptional regulator [Moraxella nonliquefaciens]MCG7411085.1 helix-turn-helix transcriptional regulator [Moraxella nonliquefaciens]
MKTQDKIRAISTQQKISQEQMAERLDLTPQAYSKIESGKTKLSLDRIQQIAQILNIDVTELIHNNDNGVFLLINENCTNENLNNGAIIYHGNQQSINEQELKHDNEKMQLIITHKDEIIEQLKQENALLKQMLNLLNTQQTNQ